MPIKLVRSVYCAQCAPLQQPLKREAKKDNSTLVRATCHCCAFVVVVFYTRVENHLFSPSFL